MAFSKAVVTGTVFRAPEKRFTQNNIAVSAFVLNIGEKEEILVRILSRRQAQDELVSSLNKGDRVLVEGRLQIATVKTDDGAERKIYEIDANVIERMGEGALAPENQKFGTEEIVKFESDDMANELINEDEIPF